MLKPGFVPLPAVENVRRYFIELAYDGTKYHGWQVQENAISVQEVVNKALSTFFRQKIETTGCGRTDTGVHAKQLYAHFDLAQQDISGTPVRQAEEANFHFRGLESINSLLPYDIAAKRITSVHAGAHARFDAVKRSYEYHIHFHKDPFKTNYSWLLKARPDVELMNRGAAILSEYTDFSCFSKSNTQVVTNNCSIMRAEWVESGKGLLFYISADRFLRNMVRAIVGTLIRVGKKEIEPEDLRKIIGSKNRSNAGASVPACGLYLTEVKYPYPLIP